MFRRLLTIILTIVLTHTCFAGISPNIFHNSIIALYQFETFDIDSSYAEYTENGGSDELHGYYLGLSDFEGEWLSEDGKFGKCLRLRGNDKITGFAEIPPQIEVGYSIVAWVKLEKQAPNTSLYFSLSGVGFGAGPYSRIMLAVVPTGNTRMVFHRIPDVLEFGVVHYTLTSENQNVADNKWHHIALSRYRGTNTLFIDGEPVTTERIPGTSSFEGEFTSINISTTTDTSLTGDVLIDEVGFFRTGFNLYEMQGLYEDGLPKFLEIMPVAPQGRLATTWGKLKSN